MYFFCADDSPSHLSNISRAVELACKDRGIDERQIVGCRDGDQLLDAISGKVPHLITLDINMPNLDGLTTLVRLRTNRVFCKIVMVTAENEIITRRHAKSTHFDADESTKRAMLERVVDRVKQGKVEQGKINSVLEACASLGMDPIWVAKQCGATACLRKPFEAYNAAQQISELI